MIIPWVDKLIVHKFATEREFELKFSYFLYFFGVTMDNFSRIFS